MQQYQAHGFVNRPFLALCAPEIPAETGTMEFKYRLRIQRVFDYVMPGDSFTTNDQGNRKQSQLFEDQKSKATKDIAVIQIDFAENYAAAFQDEIQSAHWHQQQASLSTAVSWVGDYKRCFIIVSDDLKNLFTVVKEEFPSLEHVHIFPDGSAAQFKNRYIILSLTYFLHDFGIDSTWNFFATAHGKGDHWLPNSDWDRTVVAYHGCFWEQTFHVLRKLTGEHLNPTDYKAMRVLLAAPVLSHAVDVTDLENSGEFNLGWRAASMGDKNSLPAAKQSPVKDACY
ncbi:hypothetical protein PR048_010721 [Dryococelus australis]|uniref:Uncharacterized protein n=1 Tax=Dryococelus australis TaxID=614101 RepID=A0ABQ9I3H4_9NEOP|nr:hypothetical protein PR048_010721 [Dryococelus australis]